MGITPRQLLRQKGTPFAVDFMMLHPVLINRPIVVTPLGVALCRPSERVLDLLPNPDIGPFTKEDGEVVVRQP